MSVTEPKITIATPADRERVVATVVAAFADDPVFRHLFPEPGYTAQATVFAQHLFDKRVASGTVWIADGGASVAMWDPPHPAAAHEPPSAYLPEGPAARLSAFDAAVQTAFPAQPFWYLGVLATDPAHAGRRLGRAVMQPGLRRAAEAGLPAYLETSTTRNVGIYERSGWTVTATVNASGVDVWILAHKPQPSASISGT